MGVQIVTNFVVGRTRTIEQLMTEDGFDASTSASARACPASWASKVNRSSASTAPTST
jgi:hypothetical protein